MHTLFVKIDDVSSDDESDEHVVTNEILMYIVHRKEALRQMGVEIQVQRVYVSDFERDDVVKALTRKGITRLPALMTDTKQVYIGVQNIVRVYENNIKSFMNGGGPPINPNDGNAVLANYYDNEISAWKKGVKHTKPVAEDEDQSIGDGGKDMMAAYNAKMAERFSGGREQQPQRRYDTDSPPPGDNVHIDDEEIRGTLNRISSNMNQDILNAAQAAEGDYDPMDDLMLRAKYAT